MEYVSVLAAAVAAYAFGAIWYMSLGKPWMKAVGITQEQVEGGAGKHPGPFIISGISVIIVAGMMRHVFSMAGIDGVQETALAGLGIGAFMVLPWIVTNYAYGMRPKTLTLIDGGYATIGCTIIGLVLGLF
ncbi:MAG: DUF1761 domain-containing protein [Rhodobacteraceae bacterium]|nr:DUF1761 domain-containing protein [Paracoccaceae bacterium]